MLFVARFLIRQKVHQLYTYGALSRGVYAHTPDYPNLMLWIVPVDYTGMLLVVLDRDDTADKLDSKASPQYYNAKVYVIAHFWGWLSGFHFRQYNDTGRIVGERQDIVLTGLMSGGSINVAVLNVARRSNTLAPVDEIELHELYKIMYHAKPI